MKTKLSSKLFTLALLFSVAPHAQANYDTTCMDLLVADGLAPSMIRYKATWVPQFETMLKMNGEISHVEYEAIMDWYKELPLVATFDNDKKVALVTFNDKTKKEMSAMLAKHRLVAVAYLPSALKKLGSVFKQACETLQREGCAEAYAYYKGMSSQEARPLTAKEEQAIKWATFYTLSPDSMAETMRGVKSQVSESQIVEHHKTAQQWRTQVGHDIVFDRFSPRDAELLYNNYVEPTIAANFERVLSLFRGTRSN